MGTVLTGAGGAPGIALGHAARLERPTDPDEGPVDLCPDDALARFVQAQARAAARLHALAEQFRSEGRAPEAGIFEAQALLVEDEFLTDEVTQLVQDQGERLEDALDEVIAQMRNAIASLDDEYLSERAADIDAVGREIHLALRGEEASPVFSAGAIIIADDLTPSQTAGLRGGMVAGFATASGGPTGHTAILARALGIPAAVGLGSHVLNIDDDMPLILDGERSTLIINPNETERAAYQQRLAESAAVASRRSTLRDQPAQLADGTRIALWANIGGPEEAALAKANGAEGIGLFRTEFLFFDRDAPPTEDEQFRAYREVLETMQGHTVVVRTLDIGGDKPLPYMPMPHEANPFLGVRGLRLCMQRPDLFQTQLRGLLRAAQHGDLWIMLPMVATPADLAWGREQLGEAAATLHKAGVPHRADVKLGIMIETPAAAITADMLAKEAAFFSIGSNDLTQYAMAVDRGQAALAMRYPHTSHAIFRLIAQAAESARKANIPIGICGELAGEPEAAAALSGLGLDELSMSPGAIPAVKERLGQITLEQARRLAAMACGT